MDLEEEGDERLLRDGGGVAKACAGGEGGMTAAAVSVAAEAWVPFCCLVLFLAVVVVGFAPLRVLTIVVCEKRQTQRCNLVKSHWSRHRQNH